MGKLRGIRDFFALERNIVVLLGAMLVLGMGGELWSRFVPKYLEALGASAVFIGTYGSIRRVVSALYQYPGGIISDKLGRKRALVLFNLVASLGYIIYLISRSWVLFLLGTFLVMVWSSMSQPAIFALIGDTLERSRRTMGFSVQSIWKRVPIVLAPPIGGWLISRLGLKAGMRVGFSISLILALVSILIQHRFYSETKSKRASYRQSLPVLWRAMSPDLKRLLLADCLVRFGIGIATIYVVLYVLNVLGASPTRYGLLISLQMTISITGYIPAARLADRFGRRPFISATFTFFTLFPLTLTLIPDERWLPVAFVINGLREIGEPARKALIVDLAAEEHRGRAIGLYYLIRGLITIPAPLLGSLLWGWNPRFPFWVASAISGTGLLIFLLREHPRR